MLNENYVALRLVTGEELLAVLTDEDEHYIKLEQPMVMKSLVNYESGREHIVAKPLCMYTDDTSFVISKKNVLFVKKMFHGYIQHYQRIVDEFNQTLSTEDFGFTPPDSTDEVNTTEDLQRKVNLLKYLQSMLSPTEEDEDTDDKRVYIQGNNTIN